MVFPKEPVNATFKLCFQGYRILFSMFEQKFAKYIGTWRQGSEYTSSDFSTSCFPYLLNWPNSTSTTPRSVVKPYSLKFV